MLSFSNYSSAGFTATDPMGNAFDTTTPDGFAYPAISASAFQYGAESYAFNADFVTQTVRGLMCQHKQITASTTWTIIHNMNREDVTANTVIDGHGSQLMFPAVITIVDANTVTLTFSVAQSGTVQVR